MQSKSSSITTIREREREKIVTEKNRKIERKYEKEKMHERALENRMIDTTVH